MGGGLGRSGLVGAVHPSVVGGGLIGGHGLAGGLGVGRIGVGRIGVGRVGLGGFAGTGRLVGAVHPAVVGGGLVSGGLVGGVGHGGRLIGGAGHGGIVTGGPVVSTGVVAHPVGVATVGGGQISHQSVHKPLQGENRGVTQSKALGSPVAAVADHPSTTHGVGSNRVRTVGVVSAGHVGHGGLVGGVGHGGVIGGGLVGAAAPVASVNGLTYGGINWG